MAVKTVIAPGCEWLRPLVDELAANPGSLPADAVPVYKGRNRVVTVNRAGHTVNIKAFRIPIFANRVAYGFLRRSKARRSYENALRLLSMGIATPAPLAYIEERRGALLANSYYLSIQEPDAVQLRGAEERPGFDELARRVAALMHQLHDNGVWMKDFSPGNVLYNPAGGPLMLVDINRMEFGVRSRQKLMRNFANIFPTDEATATLARAYDPEAVEAALAERRRFIESRRRKSGLKKLLRR